VLVLFFRRYLMCEPLKHYLRGFLIYQYKRKSIKNCDMLVGICESTFFNEFVNLTKQKTYGKNTAKWSELVRWASDAETEALSAGWHFETRYRL